MLGGQFKDCFRASPNVLQRMTIVREDTAVYKVPTDGSEEAPGLSHLLDTRSFSLLQMAGLGCQPTGPSKDQTQTLKGFLSTVVR